MRQILFPPTLGFSILLLTGALDRQTLFSNPAAEEAFVPQSATFGAGRLLDEVLAAFSPERIQWLEMTVRQKMWGDDPFEAVGRYVLGTQQRLRLEMDISVEGKTTKVLAVSDGRSFQKSQQIDGVKTILERCRLGKEEKGVDAVSLTWARQKFLDQRGYGGLVPLLRQISDCLVNPCQQVGVWHERRVIRVHGFWNAAEAVLNTLPENLRARSCSLYLDPDTLWPHRIEWLGSDKPGDHQVILLEMEFSEPAINQPLSAAACARMFTIHN
ncbi:MAG TPA: hypothetical protein VEQ16_08140 [Acidocella sp.]|nr:hypothetical protein [Acidocella sp.]